MESRNLIDKEELLSFLDSRAGFYDFIEDLAKEYSDYNMTSLLEFAEEIMDGFSYAVKNAEVVEERKSTICNCYTTMPGDYPIYQYFCGECSEWVESNMDNEEYKFCPYCGAKYERIVKND